MAKASEVSSVFTTHFNGETVTTKMKVHVELSNKQLKVCLRCRDMKKGYYFFQRFYLDEFTDLDLVYSDLKFLHILEIVMKNRTLLFC